MYELFQDLVYPCMFELSHACQLAIGELHARRLTLNSLPELFAHVPRPASLPGAMIARSALTSFTERCALEHHRAFHIEMPPRHCGFDPSVHRVDVQVDPTNWSALDPRAVINKWACMYQRAFATAHGPDFVGRARERLQLCASTLDGSDETGRGVPTIAKMARDIGCSPRTLRRHFAAAADRPCAYRTRERVGAAITLLRTTDLKIEIIAATVAWKSKKDLYTAFAGLLGTTPAVVRRMSDAEMTRLLDRLQSNNVTSGTNAQLL